MLTFPTESSLLDPVRGAMRRKGYRRQQPEMQFFDYRIDLYGYAPSICSTVAVELKLKKWMRAFEQALIYQLCADYVYIALPAPSMRLIDSKLLCEHGIGLISVQPGPRCQTILPASPSSVVEPDYRNYYVDLLKEGARCR
jgi:hypothetical protein